MTFLAEWGDRSQLATIVLAAREEITGVVSSSTRLLKKSFEYLKV